ncbi:unnamed protein product [Nippostrongylus brasiliensis]|uniref:DDE_3 domain-containing protein n=1 Tax=Nippostrongylus brasiliensis TaxID=27835 RepID=A0A0N4YF35_NIPBR|nr:unnamed protein product [Nippostrongylus brasiliensis]
MQEAARHMDFYKRARSDCARKKMVTHDEKKFNPDSSDGCRHYWRDLRQPPMVFSRRNFGGGSLMIWGGFYSSGKLKLSFRSCRMDSLEYQGVLESSLLPFLGGRRRQTHVLQPDNAANMWRIVVRQVYEDNKQFSSVEQLKRAVVIAWDNVSDEVIRNFVGSKGNRVLDVIRENGGPIDC